jgi:hypothetical protein
VSFILIYSSAKRWFEVREIGSKHAYNVAMVVEMAWLMHYPAPSIITYDKGMECPTEFGTMVKNKYGLILQTYHYKKPAIKYGTQKNAQNGWRYNKYTVE